MIAPALTVVLLAAAPGVDAAPTCPRPTARMLGSTSSCAQPDGARWQPRPPGQSWLAPWIDPTQVSGANHRIDWVVTAGHGFWMGKRLGTHLYAGWNHWQSSYEVDYHDTDVHGRAMVSGHHFVSGGKIALGYRFCDRIGIHMLFGAPFSTASSYAIGLG